MTRQRTAGRIITIVALCCIGFFTLRPAPEQANTVAAISPWCFVGCDDLGLLDVILNVILFLPLGLGLRLLWGTRAAIGIGFCTSLAIELTQLHLIVGRDASLRDVLANTLGTALGAILVSTWRPVCLPSARSAAWLAPLAGAAWLGVLLGTGFAYQSDLPSSTWFGQWAPALGQFDTFPGTVQDVHLDGLFLPGGRLANGPAVRARMSTSRYEMRVALTTGPPTVEKAPIFSIFDDAQREILVLAQKGNSVHFRTRIRAGSLELRSPSTRLNGFPMSADVPIEIQVLRDGPKTRITLETRDQEAESTHQETLGDGWALLLPWNYAFGAEAPLCATLWLGGLLFPAAFWAGRSCRFRSDGLLIGGVVLIGLGLLPRIWGLDPAPWWQWVGSATSAAVGWSLGRAT